MSDELEEFSDGLEECAGDEMVGVADDVAEDTAESVAEDASHFAPVDTGRLQESIYVSPWNKKPGIRHVIAGTEYSKYVEYGTAPHVIMPSSRTTYDEPYLHPGATARPYMRPALYYNRRTMHRVFRRHIRRLFRRKLR